MNQRSVEDGALSPREAKVQLYQRLAVFIASHRPDTYISPAGYRFLKMTPGDSGREEGGAP